MLKFAFILNEEVGTDAPEEALRNIEGVGSVETLVYDRLG